MQFRASNNRCRRCYFSFEVEPPPPPPVVEAEAHPNIAAGVRNWRRLRGLTQKALASAAHLPRTYISRIENGRILPGLGTLERVALALHVNLPALLDRQLLTRRGEGCSHPSFSPFGFGQKPANGNGNGNGHGHSNGNGHFNGNGNGNGTGKSLDSASDEDFLRQMLRYTGLLTTTQKAVVLARIRQLAGARS